MASTPMTPARLALVAEQFKALAEPARLSILQTLMGGERTVTDLQERTGLTQTNLSKHLRLLHEADFVTRRKDGLYVYYALADDRVNALCDLMCARLDDRLARQRAALGA